MPKKKKENKDYELIKKRSGRYAVKGKDGKYVNGVDLITCDDDGRIVEFKVMIRPLQAVNLVHERMRAMLEAGVPDPV